MTDPWVTFLSRADGREAAGYFEQVRPAAEGGTWALAYLRGEPLSPVGLGTTAEGLDAEVRRRLHRNPAGAVVGFLSFEAVSLFEPLLPLRLAGSPYPMGELLWVDHPRMYRNLRPPHRRVRPTGGSRSLKERPRESLGQHGFMTSVRRIKEAILDGQAFQVVLAHRREWERPDDLLARATTLRSEERYRTFFYLRSGDREILGATPESVVERSGPKIELHPIAGTRPRWTRRRKLGQDPKELAEHRMLVDLARNDLGRICRPGSVRVASRERVERFARLEHLVSRVEGVAQRGVGPFATLRACFPAGTVTGAPKVRATSLLRAEEKTWRGPYAGAIGAVLGHDRSVWALPIRSAFTSGHSMHTAAGAGLVHASRPSREWNETLTKLREVESVLAGPSPG